jgi:KaiC/GvpD/RAD55 family RecA-like ATPase
MAQSSPGESAASKTAPARAAKGAKASSAKTAPATRTVTVPSAEDFEHAKDDALLQLKIGRSAHLYGVIVSAVLALDGVLLLLFYPTLPSLSSSETGAVALSKTFFLLLPLLGGLAIALVGLATKWEEYQLWPWEIHFSTTVGAVVANVLIAIVFGLRIAGEGSFATIPLFPWFYAVELAGISLAFVGFVLTWNAWTRRQWASALSAVLPIATALLVYFPPSTTTGSSALAVSLLISAILYQTSGSFLHLISSGTRPHERELITSGQTKMFRFADEIRQREEALHFREASQVKREADVENSIASINRQNDSLKEARALLDNLEEDYRKRSDSLAEKERKWAGQVAAMDAQNRLIEDKGKGLEIREQEVQRLVPQISAREQRLVEREGEQTKRDVDLTQRQQELERRLTSVPETEARLEARKKELDQKTAELLRREGELAAVGSPTKPGGAAPGRAGTELATREVKLQQLKAALDEQNIALGRRARENADRAKAIDAAQERTAAKEAALASREEALRQREAELGDLTKAADARRAQYDAAARDYESRVQDFGRTQVDSAQKGADLDRSLKSLADRETALADREKKVRALAQAVQQREQTLTTRERSVEATEAEISLRRQAIERSGDLPIAGLAAMAAADRWDRSTGGSTGRGATDRAPGIRDLSAGPVGPAETPNPSETLSAPVVRRFPDRLSTGTPRLDDLLLGGIPPKGHVVLLGDAFVGKEVVLYAFIAEGLKRGEPAILITAARSPTEVSQSLGVVLPQFREYEQMGMVRWIDASGSGGTSGGPRTVVKGSDDRAGILSNLVQAANALEGGRSQSIRVGFLGLSAVLAHGDERAAFSFLQNVVGILKPRKALAMYSLEGGALSEAQVETLLSRMDGAIIFRQDRDRTFLSVKGFGDVQTRDWVECRATQRSLIIGSFALERIR